MTLETIAPNDDITFAIPPARLLPLIGERRCAGNSAA
jgi:hypothetical protein